jgi:class 3 adenylate cyclase
LEAQLDFIVIYSDIVGSTKTVKNLTPNQVRRFYPIFLNEMTNVINDFGGRVLKYVGDCIIGFFILPNEGWIPQVDRVFLCVKMMARIMKDSISPVAQGEGLPAMSCRIGADCGEVQVIKIGVEGIYTEVDVFGDVMNVTKKICDQAKSGEILVGKNLWDLFYTSHKERCEKTKSLQRDGESYDLYALKYE